MIFTIVTSECVNEFANKATTTAAPLLMHIGYIILPLFCLDVEKVTLISDDFIFSMPSDAEDELFFNESEARPSFIFCLWLRQIFNSAQSEIVPREVIPTGHEKILNVLNDVFILEVEL